MTAQTMLRRVFVDTPAIAASLYAATLLILLWLAASAVIDLVAQYEQLGGAGTMLSQIESRKGKVGRRADGAAAPGGSVFVEGTTFTVAGAALVQRVADAIAKAGGNVLSTQVDLQGSQAKAGFVSVVASCEVDQPGLQAVLYDIEAGFPFLFVDQLDVQAPSSVAASGEGRLRVLLTVSGQWQGKN